MEGLTGFNDVMEQVAKASNSPAKNKQISKPQNLEEALFKGITNEQARKAVYNQITKDLRSTDINGLRLVSLAGITDELANDEALFTMVCEANPVVPCSDLHVQWQEKRLGSDTADWINLNVDTFGSEAAANRPIRTNTIGFAGNSVSVRLLTQALSSQSPIDQANLVLEEIRFEAMRIRRFFEGKLLSNNEVVTEGLVSGTQPGGMITRSTLYNNSVSGDLTNAAIQGRVDAIANAADPEGLGYGIPLMAMVSDSSQLPKVRDLMTTRYPGEASSDALAYQAKLQGMFAKAGMAPNQVKFYQPDPGSPVMFVYNPLMVADTVLYFDPRKPRLGKFQINGQYGMWAIERPTAALTNLVYCFDGMTLIDGPVEYRAVTTLT